MEYQNSVFQISTILVIDFQTRYHHI